MITHPERWLAFPRPWWSLAAAAVLAGCAAFEAPPAAPPSGALSVDVAAPPIGTSWIVKTVHEGGTSTTRADSRTWTVIGTGEYQARPVYHVSDGSHVNVYDRTSGSWVAVLDRAGTPIRSAEPHDGSLASPLWVGRRWVARYTGHDHARGRTFYDMTFGWEVVAYEEVDGPAGRVKAFRVRRAQADDRSLSLAVTYWYAPSLGVVVRQTSERLDEDDWARRRPIRSTEEVVGYTAAPARAAAPLPRSSLAAVTIVPVEVRRNLTLTHVTVNGTQRVPFIVDTGASSTIITPAVAARLGLHVSAGTPRRRTTVADGRDVSVPFVRISAVQVGDATVENLEVGVLDVAPQTPAIGGLLGGDFLGRFTMTVDHARRELRLGPSTSGNPK